MTLAIAWCVTVALISLPAFIVFVWAYEHDRPHKGANAVFGIATLTFFVGAIGGFFGAVIAFIWSFVP